MDFEKKKIQLETLSEYLKVVREGLGMSEEEVSAKTNIKLRFVEALENGQLKDLPPDVYVFGFLRQLAEVYSVDSRELISQYKKEKAIQNQISLRSGPKTGKVAKYVGRVVVTPKLIGVVLGFMFVGVTLGYIIWQVGSINRVPDLEVYQPQDHQVVTDSFVNVSGKTDPGMNVTVNGQDVFVDTDGGFKAQLGMEAGPTMIEIVASNKFGKTASKVLNLIGQQQDTATTTPVQLKLEFSGDGTLLYTVDESGQQRLEFHSGDTKVLTGKQKVVISTTNAGATKANLNGQNMGFLGRGGEKLVNIPFFAGSAPPPTATTTK